MPRFKPAPLPVLIQKFYKHAKPGQIMFCKKYKVENIWDIGVGAILDLNAKPHPHFVHICQSLFLEDPDWFVGDIQALLNYDVE